MRACPAEARRERGLAPPKRAAHAGLPRRSAPRMRAYLAEVRSTCGLAPPKRAAHAGLPHRTAKREGGWLVFCGTFRENRLSVGAGSVGFKIMTRNRTAIDTFSTLGTELMVVLLVVLAMGLSVSQYFTLARDRVRRGEVKLRRRAARRLAA